MSETTTTTTEPTPINTSAPLARMPGESDAAYDTFLCFLESGEERRSVKALAQELGGSEHTFAEWCTKFQWRARRRAYFASLFRKQLEAGLTDGQDDPQVKAQRRDTIERQLDEILRRLTESSINLLEHKLMHQSQDFKIPHILRMIRTVADQLARTKSFAAPVANSHSQLRKELLAVGEFARQLKLKEDAAASGNGTPLTVESRTPQPPPAVPEHSDPSSAPSDK